MNKRIKIVFLLLSVMILCVCACLLVACHKGGEETVSGGEGATTPPTEEKTVTKVIITIDGEDTDTVYTFEYKDLLTLRKYERPHYQFVRYVFTAPSGVTYESDVKGDYGQNWAKENTGNSAGPLSLVWTDEEIRIAAEFTPITYQIKYKTGLENDNGIYDLYYSAKEGDELGGISGTFSTQIGNVMASLKGSYAGHKIDGIYAVQADGSTRKVLNDQPSFVTTSAETLNGNDYYLDDAKKTCLLQIVWKIDAYKLYFTGWTDAQNGQQAVEMKEVEYWKSIRLSDQFDQTMVVKDDYVHIGWTTREDDEYLFADTAEYALDATYVNNSPSASTVILYAVWGSLPSAPASENCKVEGLKISVTPNDPVYEKVEYFYTTTDGGAPVKVKDGDLSVLDKGKTYIISADVYRNYGGVEARRTGVYNVSVKPIDAPSVYVINDTEVNHNRVGVSVTDHSTVNIVIDDEVIGVLSELEAENAYFLNEAQGGNYRMRAYTSYMSEGVLCQSVCGEVCSFSVREGTCGIRVSGGYLRLETDCTLFSTSNYNITATLSMKKGGSESEKTYGATSNFNKNGYMTLASVSELIEGDYFLCKVTLLGSDGELSNDLYVEVRKTDGVLVYVDADGKRSQIEEE